MRRLVTIVFALPGVAAVIWGATLIHSSFVHEQELIFMLKTGNGEVAPKLMSKYQVEAWKQVVVQVGLVILGTSAAVLAVIASLRRKGSGKHVEVPPPN